MHLITLLAQAQVADPLSVRELLQYAANGATVGAFAFIWRVNARLATIETLLTGPRGAMRAIEDLESRTDKNAIDIARVHMSPIGPDDIGSYSRRTPERKGEK